MDKNVFYYSSMKPNEIYSAADQYLNRDPNNNADVPQANSNFYPPQQQSQKEGPANAGNVYYQSGPAAYQAPLGFQGQAPPVYQSPPAFQQQQQVINSPSSSPSISSKIKHLMQHDPSDLLFKDLPVKVAEVINPANFYLVLQEKNEEYAAMKKEMEAFYQMNAFSLPVDTDHLYAAILQETKEWGRIKVLSFTSKFCCAHFIDEGVTHYVPEDQIFLLDDKFKNLPARSFKAAILGKSLQMHQEIAS